MFKKEIFKYLISFVVILSVNNVRGQSDKLVLNLPKIQTENLQVYSSDNKEYQVSLILPNSERSELIKLDPVDGQVVVKGSINTYYPESNTNLLVNYVADKNGYRASYKITNTPSIPSITFDTRLSGNDLKTLAG
ncbi:uncharacterized protein LOC111681198 [Lucilia cuprina]|uniref:uncharacterized protein LOC111681198 n=1 Tax=Lucilia cuprina TaxID=7375 RepID=UPI001F0656C0|nr:uncharacterized protein LOC111681198 [Lucilia cuprina]